MIEVTFDIDANETLNISARDTTSGMEEKITFASFDKDLLYNRETGKQYEYTK